MANEKHTKKNVCVHICVYFVYICVCVCLYLYPYIYYIYIVSCSLIGCRPMYVFQSELILSAVLILSDRVLIICQSRERAPNLPPISGICLWFRKTCRRVKIRAKTIQCELKQILCSSINVMLILIFQAFN